jgi:Fur family peroxide stress response transcriptional regulator
VAHSFSTWINTVILGYCSNMSTSSSSSDQTLRRELESRGHRFTDQRAAVYRLLAHTTVHPTADEVFLGVREEVPGISLATVYKSLETIVSCGLACKLSHANGSARYDGRTDPHHHARCITCGAVSDIAGELRDSDLTDIRSDAGGFQVTGYQLELTGYCPACAPEPSIVLS